MLISGQRINSQVTRYAPVTPLFREAWSRKRHHPAGLISGVGSGQGAEEIPLPDPAPRLDSPFLAMGIPFGRYQLL